MSPSNWFISLWRVTLLCLLTLSGFGHQIDHLSATVDVREAGHTLHLELSAEARQILEDHQALSLLPALNRGGAGAEEVLPEVLAHAQAWFAENAAILADGVPLACAPLTLTTLAVAERDAVSPSRADSAKDQTHLFLVGTWTGPLPATAHGLQLKLTNRAAGVWIRRVDGVDAGPPKPYFIGETSPPWAFREAGKKSAATDPAHPPERASSADSWTARCLRYIAIGVNHICPPREWFAWLKSLRHRPWPDHPDGLDHILFVLGLYFLSRRLKPLLWQVTAFTVAHSVTLALAMLGLVHVPARPVEIAIALSIAFVAIENLFRESLSRWRTAIVFLFGLVHGLGFAGSFQDLQVPQDQFLSALFSMNVGVELGQLGVLALIALLTAWAWPKSWYRQRLSLPASVIIAGFGLYWAWQRWAE
jgi:hydrogenase/urease accessory protein HupE